MAFGKKGKSKKAAPKSKAKKAPVVDAVPEDVLEKEVAAKDAEPAPKKVADEKPKAEKKSSDDKPLKPMDADALLSHEDDEEPAGEDAASGGKNDAAALRVKRARNRIWLDLRDGIDLKALARMDAKAARDEVYSAVEEISRFRNLDLTPAELKGIAKECANDMLGFGPLEELLERDDIADIMINGPDIFISVTTNI